MNGSSLSLRAAFDDLVRNTKVLTQGIEPEFIQLVRNQDECRKRWLDAEQRLDEFKKSLKKYEAENKALETKLKHARRQIENEMNRRLKVEQERDSLERQVALIRELLSDKKGGGHLHLNDEDKEKLSFLSGPHKEQKSPGRLSAINESSTSCLSDISYDKTEDDLDLTYLRSGRRVKRPSAPLLEDERSTPPNKRNKSDGQNTSITTTVTTSSDGARVCQEISSNVPQVDVKFSRPKASKTRRRPSRDLLKSNAEDSDDSFWGIGSKEQSHQRPVTRQTRQNVADPPEQSPTLKHWGSGSRGIISNRNHIFVAKTIIKPETCIPCGKRIKFGKLAMKCRDCRTACHPDCKDQVPLPCMPTGPRTPGKDNRGFMLSDFTNSSSPMIPALLIHCVNEVEARGLTEVGIYRVPGSEREVKDLTEKFMKGKGTPNLGNIDDIHVICGCVKDFLRRLKEALVTFRLWNDFVNAAENTDNEESLSETYQAISQLPQSNRDTLAFLILHLQRIAQCEACKMPLSNLAKVFGPTIIGYSSPDPEPLQMINQTKKQQAVMERLLTIPSDYWFTFINAEDERMMRGQSATPATPEYREGYPLNSMLGPVNTPLRQTSSGSISKKARSIFSKASTSRFGSKSKSGASHFFSSPMLK